MAALVVVADQICKWWILAVVMSPPRTIEVTGFFNLVLVMNRGASFGLFGGAAPWMSWVLAGFAVLIAAALLLWMRMARTRLFAATLGLVAGGAIGNVIDRARFGAVVDFLDFHLRGWHWPAFNLADSAITVGVALLILDSLKSDAARA